jgi:hypothetical protein
MYVICRNCLVCYCKFYLTARFLHRGSELYWYIPYIYKQGIQLHAKYSIQWVCFLKIFSLIYTNAPSCTLLLGRKHIFLPIKHKNVSLYINSFMTYTHFNRYWRQKMLVLHGSDTKVRRLNTIYSS